MATFVGTVVDVTLGAAVYQLNGLRWTINATCEAVETTAGWDAANNFRTYGPGWQNWTGTIEARADDTTALVVPGAEVAGAVFTYNATGATGNQLAGTVIITGMDVTAERNGECTVTWSFQGDGILTPT